MDGQPIEVVENNEHLGQIFSGFRQEEKNIELRIKKSHKSLFALLGPAFSFKCLLSPVVKLHLYRTFVCPVLLHRHPLLVSSIESVYRVFSK